uniref:BY PROTMAP: gi/647401258/emb/CDR47384.1/ RHTO0S14e02784g1_1 [Rhodosporidium toruloides] n=1 Tax=Rhodotorula toruloides TaxID=5286 RepID=A0A0K3CAL4_RHOTO
MGFCRSCGEITTGERCKCGGTSKETVTKALFGTSTSDRWSQRYVSRSPPKSPSPAPPESKTAYTATTPLGTPSRTLVAPARPPSPTKLAQSFLQQDDGELSSVFGSVLSPKDNWQCAACTSKFRQEEVIYPHPDVKSDASLAEVFFCRQCFAERFRKGNCKRCKYAVLSDAPFVKYDGNLWHEACYTCSYCEDPSTSPVIDFAGLPSCEACFDSEAYKTRGIPPSPHLSQSEWGKKPVSVLPPPSKWGRPSLPSASLGAAKKSNVWTSKAAPASSSSYKSTVTVNEEKPKAWRVRAERDKSPIAPSLDELGTRLRQAGLVDTPAAAGQTSPLKPGATTTGASSNPSSMASTKSSSFARPASPVKTSSRPASGSNSVFASNLLSPTKPTGSPARPALAPVQPTANPPRPLPSPVQPPSPTKLPSSAPQPTLAPADPDTCPICRLDLGYGEFVELPKTGQVMHRDCFRCGGCEERLGTGKHVEAEGRWWHQQCAPAPKRYRTIITSLAEPDASSDDAPAPEPPLTAELDADDPSCSGCGRPLGYGQSVTIPRSGKSFHKDCFCCAGCSGALGEQRGERGFVEVAGLPYHQKCTPPPASPSPAILASPFFASDALTSSRSTRLPTLPSFPPKHLPPPSLSSSPAPREPSIFSRLRPPPSNLGGHLLCAGCSTRATEKETVLGPRGRRYHAICLRCERCGRGLDSECRVGEGGELRCEGCRTTATKPSYRANFTSSTPLASSSPVSPRRF